ncbi:MAG: ABC transporter ATP-binding protein, partial [Sphingomonas sp.]|nr:ABC transporter ATP-binding protein [Sphingomonas sp.]
GLDGSGHVDVVAGGYADWVRQRGPKPELRPAQAAPARAEPPTPSKPRAKLSYKDQRDLELLPVEIERLEAAIARDEAALADADLYVRDPKKFDQLMKAIDKARQDREAAEMRWLELAEMAENLAS